jgi:uncharacterized protein YecE (DUF72 family)
LSRKQPTPAGQGVLFQPPARNASLRVGPAGWNYKDWEGVVYPRGAGKSFDPLAFLASYFDTVEINSSFYAPPRPEDAAAWARRVRANPRFKFTAKAWQRISHQRIEARKAGSLAADCDEVRRSLSPLLEAGVLGAVLIQFPWSFRHSQENVSHLELLFKYLSDLPLALEVRHASWDLELFFTFLRDAKVAFCNVDQPVIGDSLPPAAHVTSRVGYFRLHGRNYNAWFDEKAGRDARYDYLYTKQEIVELTQKIAKVKQTADETYAITNNHFRGQALVNALDILEEMDAVPPAEPPQLVETYPWRFECTLGGSGRGTGDGIT